MRILISVDLEGIAGVPGREDIMPGNVNYERFRRQTTQEANAAVDGAFDAGADSVVVNDSHGRMRNLLYEELDPRAELISGHNKVLKFLRRKWPVFGVTSREGGPKIRSTGGQLGHL
ncbi:MAG: M55 family metallopeptidase [Firmicutes bacterium]|nr:M55 family metallopeptidase [Bacillota bacterium]